MIKFLTRHVHREEQDEQDRQVGRMRKIKNEIIVHILPDPPAKRTLFFFSTSLSCNRPACQATPESDPPATLKSDPPPVFSLITTAA